MAAGGPAGWRIDRGVALRALALAACTVLLLVAGPVLLPHRPGEAFPAFLGVVAAAALWLGQRAAYWALGACTVLMARFLLQGEGFSVTDPAEALGLIVFTLVGLFLVTAIGRLRLRLTNTESVLAAARAERDGKAALLAEIAHRVANDVGSLAAMARLQANGAADEDPRAILLGFAARVEVFGSLYRRLNVESKAAGTIEMVEFLGDLCDELRAAHLGLRPIVLDFAGEPCRMSPPRAAKVGLVLNEAVMNALK